jgi:hypothetical protein
LYSGAQVRESAHRADDVASRARYKDPVRPFLLTSIGFALSLALLLTAAGMDMETAPPSDAERSQPSIDDAPRADFERSRPAFDDAAPSNAEPSGPPIEAVPPADTERSRPPIDDAPPADYEPSPLNQDE